MTAPVSAGSVSTRIASSAAVTSCSGRSIRSKKRETGLKQSLTDSVASCGASSCCSTGCGARVAKVSLGSSSTGSRLMVASAAPVTMFVAPGPTDVVHAKAPSRLRWRA